MSDSQAVLDPDRLPWLTDDRQPRGKRAWTSVLLLAIVATLLLAGVSYWLGMESVRRVGDLAAGAPQRAAPGPLQQQPQPSPLAPARRRWPCLRSSRSPNRPSLRRPSPLSSRPGRGCRSTNCPSLSLQAPSRRDRGRRANRRSARFDPVKPGRAIAPVEFSRAPASTAAWPAPAGKSRSATTVTSPRSTATSRRLPMTSGAAPTRPSARAWHASRPLRPAP